LDIQVLTKRLLKTQTSKTHGVGMTSYFNHILVMVWSSSINEVVM